MDHPVYMYNVYNIWYYVYTRRVQFTFRTLSGRVRFIFRTFPADTRHVLLHLQFIYSQATCIPRRLYTPCRGRCCRGWWWWSEGETGKSFLVRWWCKRTIFIHIHYAYIYNIYRYRGKRLWLTPRLFATPASANACRTVYSPVPVVISTCPPPVVLYIYSHIWRRKEE